MPPSLPFSPLSSFPFWYLSRCLPLTIVKAIDPYVTAEAEADVDVRSLPQRKKKGGREGEEKKTLAV